jgi:hypothetical protein
MVIRAFRLPGYQAGINNWLKLIANDYLSEIWSGLHFNLTVLVVLLDFLLLVLKQL